MASIEDVPAHSAFVGGEQVLLTIPLSLDGPSTLVLSGTDAGEYAFVTGPELSPPENTVSLSFSPTKLGPASATLSLGQASVDLNGEGKPPVVFSQDELDFGQVLVGGEAVKGFLVENHSSEDVQLGLASGAFTLSPTSIPPIGVPVFVAVTFHPGATQTFTRTVSATVDGLTESLNLTGVGTDTLQDGTIEQDFGDKPVNGDVPPATRFSVFVPEHSSRFNMGSASPDGVSDNPILIDGIGLTTDKKILINGVGSESESQAAFSANGKVFVQSNESDVLCLGGRHSIMAAAENAYVLGDGGVLIATTAENTISHDDEGFPNVDLDGDGGPSTLGGAHIASAFFLVSDAFIAGIGGARSIYHAAHSEFTAPLVTGAIAGVTGFMAAAASLFALGERTALPAVTIYGHAGLLMGTPGFGALHCAAGLALTSAFPILAGLDVEVFGAAAARITGHRAGIGSNMETAVKSHRKVLIKADGEPPQLPVPAIAKLGPLVASMNGKLAETMAIQRGDVEIEAGTQVKSHITGGYSLTMEHDSLTVAGPTIPANGLPGPMRAGELELSTQQVQFSFGAIQLTLDGNGATLVAPGHGTVALTANQISMTGANNETATLANGTIQLDADTVELVGAGRQGLRLNPYTCELKGSRIVIG